MPSLRHSLRHSRSGTFSRHSTALEVIFVPRVAPLGCRSSGHVIAWTVSHLLSLLCFSCSPKHHVTYPSKHSLESANLSLVLFGHLANPSLDFEFDILFSAHPPSPHSTFSCPCAQSILSSTSTRKPITSSGTTHIISFIPF